MRRGARILALARFSTVANLRSGVARAGLVSFFVIAALGQALARTRSEAAPRDDRLFGFAFLVGVLLLLRSGLAEQRRLGLDEFLAHNFIRRRDQVAAHALALVLQLAGFMAFCLVAGTILSGGDPAFAAWYTAVMGLSVALFLPAVLLVEVGADLRLPFILVPLGLLVAMAVAEPTIGADTLLRSLGLRFVRYDPATLLPLLKRVGVVWGAGFGTLILLHGRR